MLTPDIENSTVTTVRKKAEFEAFLKIIKKGRVENWSVIAEALGVREATISEWKQRPLAQKAITEGIERCMSEMERAGKNDWKMWRDKLKMLGVKDKELESPPIQVIQGVFNNPAMWKKYSIKEPITQSPRPLLAAAALNKPQEQTPSDKPMVDPKLLEQIQERLLEMQGKADRLKEKLDAKQAEIESPTSLSGWH